MKGLTLIGLLAVGLMGCWHASPLGSDEGGGGDADSDADSDADADVDTDADANTDSDCTGPGVWHDESSNLCWQDPPPGGTYTWSDAISYCNDLLHGGHSDWRLPDIDELITMIRGCQDGTATGDLSPSLCEMTPAGCVATDSCDGNINCSWCPWNPPEGPGADGCYWDPALSGTWWGYYWSSSSRAASASFAWVVSFHIGYVPSHDKTGYTYARCVRGGP
jgi:hypothetical protein